jgi:hypothetical protein
MIDPVIESLILDLLEWIGTRDRTYDEAMDAWRTSCPKLPVWEEANDRGFVTTAARDNDVLRVSLTRTGLGFLIARRTTNLATAK